MDKFSCDYRKFNTSIGGIISICSIVVIALYSYLSLKIMIEKKGSTTGITETLTDLNSDNDPIMFKNSSFMFGAHIYSYNIGQNLLLDETYLSMKVYQGFSNGDVDEKNYQVPVETCTKGHFSSINSTILENINIGKYLCPKSNDFTLQGGYLSPFGYKYILVLFEMCIGTTSSGLPCKSEDDIKYAIDGAALELSFVNSYFDFNDYETPIKDYLDDRVYNSILKGYSRGNDIFVRKNTSNRRDSIYSYTTDSVTDIFTSVDSVSNQMWPEYDHVAANIYFFKDGKSVEYDRQVLTLLNCLGNIGGVGQLLDFIAQLLLSLFSGRIFMFSIISSLYQVDTKVQKKNEEAKFEDSIIFNHDLDPELIRKAVETMKSRFRYDYSFFDIAYNFAFPFKCLMGRCKRNIYNIHSRFLLFKNGEKKLLKEFDAVEFARTQRKLKMLMHSLMDENERFLAPYQMLNSISLLSDSSSNHSDDPAYSKIPKLFCDAKAKQIHCEIIEKFLNKYLMKTHSEKDINLLHGVFAKDELTNDRQEFYLLKSKSVRLKGQSRKAIEGEDWMISSPKPKRNSFNLEESKDELQLSSVSSENQSYFKFNSLCKMINQDNNSVMSKRIENLFVE